MKAESFLGLVLVNHLLQQLIQIKLVLQQSTTKRTIEKIWESKATSKKPWKCILHKTILGKTPSKFAILFHLKPSDFRFVTWFKSFLKFWSSMTVVWSFSNKNWDILNYFSLVQKEYNDFKLKSLRQTCQRNHVLNYASGNSLGTK